MKTNFEQRIHRRVSKSRLLAACLIALAVWSFDQMIGLSMVDGFAYDSCLKLKNRFSRVPSRVMLVTLDRLNTDTPLAELTTKLEFLGAKSIGVLFHNSHVIGKSREPNEPIESNPKSPRIAIVNGCAVAQDPGNGLLSVLPVENRENAHFGLLRIPASRDGVHRVQRYGYATTTGTYFTLESRLAVEAGVEFQPEHLTSPYRINFSGAPESLPCVTASDVMAGRLVPELLENRIVLIGFARDATDPGLTTPTTSARNKMSLLEFHGHALNSLLAGKQIHRCSLGFEFAILLMVSVTVLTMCYPLRWWVSLQLVFVILILETSFCIWLLSTLCVWLPLSQMSLVQAICFLAVHQRRQTNVNVKLESLRRTLNDRLGAKIAPDLQLIGVEDVGRAIQMLKQLLGLRRIALLGVEPRSHRLRQLAAVNCETDELASQTHDFRRSPYSDTSHDHGMIKIESKHKTVFATAGPSEHHYLIRLSVARRTLGFLAVAIDDKIIGLSETETILLKYAEQITKLLYQLPDDQLWADQPPAGESHDGHVDMIRREKQPSLTARLLTGSPEQNQIDQLSMIAGAMERRLLRLENAIEKSNVAFAVFDVFGKLVVTNSRMTATVQTLGGDVYSLSTVDLISKITHCGPTEARNVVHAAIYHARSWTMAFETNPTTREKSKSNPTTPSISPSAKLANFELRPLIVDGFGAAELSGPDFFGVKGIVCELIEIESPTPHQYAMPEIVHSKWNSLPVQAVHD